MEKRKEKNVRENPVEEVTSVEKEVAKISEDEVRTVLKRIKSGKADCPDNIPVEVWKCLGKVAVVSDWTVRHHLEILERERIPKERRRRTHGEGGTTPRICFVPSLVE